MSRSSSTTAATARGVGAPVRRNEDERHLRGQGRYVADLHLPGTREVAFVRSPLAHGRLLGVRPPAGEPAATVWTGADLAPHVRPIVADLDHPNFRHAEYPVVAHDTVRYAGEPVALVVGDDRATAEDLAGGVEVDIEPLPVVVDPIGALQPDAPRVHADWDDNRVLVATADLGDVDAARDRAAVSITRYYHMDRQGGIPMENRGCLAHYDTRTARLVLHVATQIPHVLRTALAELLDLPERRLQVVALDVGGGFGIKSNVDPEVAAVAAVALQVPYPVRWIEDRWEHLTSAAQARDHRYRVTAYASTDGELLGLDADVLVDAGAYSVWPWTAAMDTGMAAAMLPGPYRVRNYRYCATTVATNKPPLGPYRGVGRPGACFAIERTVDELAYVLGLEPNAVRLRNLVRAQDMPYTSVTGRTYDSGDYPESVRRAAALVDHEAVRDRQAAGAREDVRLGIGYATFTEQTAHGTTEWATRGLPAVFGFERATAVLDPSGGLTVGCGLQTHGQGLETTLAQVAHDVLGLDPASITVRHGDTDTTPYGVGTFASRSMVMGGGAARGACEALAEKIKDIAAALTDNPKKLLTLADGAVVGPSASVSFAEVAQAAYLHLDRLPPDIDPCLEVTYTYRPRVDTGAFAYATHAAVVEVDVESATVRVVDYAVVEDCGTVVNPLIVAGQVYGGVAQGIGSVLYEAFTFDELGQPTATTFLDYLLPGATEVPAIRLEHLETPSPFTEMGVKGAGEGGAIAPPAAIANAVADALRHDGVNPNATPLTPARLARALHDPPDRAEPPWPEHRDAVLQRGLR